MQQLPGYLFSSQIDPIFHSSEYRKQILVEMPLIAIEKNLSKVSVYFNELIQEYERNEDFTYIKSVEADALISELYKRDPQQLSKLLYYIGFYDYVVSDQIYTEHFYEDQHHLIQCLIQVLIDGIDALDHYFENNGKVENTSTIWDFAYILKKYYEAQVKARPRLVENLTLFKKSC